MMQQMALLMNTPRPTFGTARKTLDNNHPARSTPPRPQSTPHLLYSRVTPRYSIGTQEEEDVAVVDAVVEEATAGDAGPDPILQPAVHL